MLKLYKIWYASETQGTVMYIWAKNADEAFFGTARKIDPKVVSCQWTGLEK